MFETPLITMLTGTAYDLPFVAAVLTGTMHACIHVHCILPGIAFPGIENKTRPTKPGSQLYFEYHALLVFS